MSGLSWMELAKSDDFLTANLIDNLDFWIETRKIADFDDSLIIHKHIIYKILKKYVIDSQKINVEKCLNHLLNQKETKKFIETNFNNSKQMIKAFKLHAKKYVEMLAPDCEFEIMTTDRYKKKTKGLESCVIARKRFEVNDEIKYLEGSFADLDKATERALKNDFSVFHTTSQKFAKLMLGPSRFVNHNCDANAKFSPKGTTGIKIIAKKVILPGEEITVTYAPNYFGYKNKDCLCSTCERNNQGYYNPNKFEIPRDAHIRDVSSDDEYDDDDLERIFPSNGKKTNTSNDRILVNIESDDEDDDDVCDDDDDNNNNNDKSVHDVNEYDIDSREGSHDITDDSDSESPILPITKDEVVPLRYSSRRLHESPKMNVLEKKDHVSSIKTTGGRKLRSRDRIKSYYNSAYNNTMLAHVPEDKSFDSLSLNSYGNHNEIVMEQRRVQRQLNKLFCSKPYSESANLEDVYDCLNCGIYFEYEPAFRYKEYCPRCVRHQKLYGLAWPDTKVTEFATSLYLDYSAIRSSIGYLRKHYKNTIVEKKKLLATTNKSKQVQSKKPTSRKFTPLKSDPKSKATTEKVSKQLIDKEAIRKQILARLGRISLPVVKNPQDTLYKFQEGTKSQTDIKEEPQSKVNLPGVFPDSDENSNQNSEDSDDENYSEEEENEEEEEELVQATRGHFRVKQENGNSFLNHVPLVRSEPKNKVNISGIFPNSDNENNYRDSEEDYDDAIEEITGNSDDQAETEKYDDGIEEEVSYHQIKHERQRQEEKQHDYHKDYQEIEKDEDADEEHFTEERPKKGTVKMSWFSSLAMVYDTLKPRTGIIPIFKQEPKVKPLIETSGGSKKSSSETNDLIDVFDRSETNADADSDDNSIEEVIFDRSGSSSDDMKSGKSFKRIKLSSNSSPAVSPAVLDADLYIVDHENGFQKSL